MDEMQAYTPETTVVLEGAAMQLHLRRMAQEIAGDNPEMERVALMGILRRGLPLAHRLAVLLESMTGAKPLVGALATTLYRDDVRTGARMPKSGGETYFDFAVDDLTVVLVDDVLAAGRTIRAAMDEIMDYGRPARIQLACMIDRGGRELPIQPDYLGHSVATAAHEWVKVRLQEIDGEDLVLIEQREAPAALGEDA